MNKISSEFNQPLFECTQILNHYFKGIIDLLNLPGDSHVYRTPYLYLLPQFPDLSASIEATCSSYESILAVRTIVGSYKHSKPEALDPLRHVTFELTPLPYPSDFLADITDAQVPTETMRQTCWFIGLLSISTRASAERTTKGFPLLTAWLRPLTSAGLLSRS